MKKIIKSFLVVIIFIHLFISTSNGSESFDEVIKIGVFQNKPYYYKDGNKDKGYYIELFDLISETSDKEYKIIYNDTEDILKELESGNIDIVAGAYVDGEIIENYSFNKHNLAVYQMGIYTHDDYDYGDIDCLDNKKIGLVNHNHISKEILEFLDKKDIDAKAIYDKNEVRLKQKLYNDDIDAIIKDSYYDDLNLIYKSDIYGLQLIAKKGNEVILDGVDKILEDNFSKEDNLINNLKINYIYDKYFRIEHLEAQRVKIANVIIISIIVILIFILAIINSKYILCYKTRKNIKNKSYKMHYHPIIDLSTSEIKGLEALIRLKKRDKLVYPDQFINEIEKSNMCSEVSLNSLNIVINDYKNIEKINSDIYISLNITIKELENDKFINKAIKLLKESNIPKEKICLEVIERVKASDFNKISTSIKILKEAGFLIAIDDFGIEYSNLDTLYKIDFDILKLDKFFIEDIDIEENELKRHILKFINMISNKKGISIVIEGIENKRQEEIIKKILKYEVLGQGYLYSKPCDINSAINLIKANK